MTRQQAVLAGYVLGGAAITTYIRYLTFYYENFTLNFFRFLSGTAAFLLVACVFSPKELVAVVRNAKQMWRIGVFSLVLVSAQYLVVEGQARLSAVLASLMFILGIPVTVIVGALFFADEKAIVTRRAFIAGSVVAFIGAVLLALSRDRTGEESAAGVLYLLAAVGIVAFAFIWLKKLVQDVNPLCVAGINFAYSCLFFLVGGLIWGDLGSVASAPVFPFVMLVVSGMVGFLAGNLLAIQSVKDNGVAITRLAELAVPVVTGIAGYVFFREALTIAQATAGMVILAGCLIIVLPRRSADGA